MTFEDGTAAAGDDYSAVDDFTITIPAGETSASGAFDLTPVDDEADEEDETLQVIGTTTVGFPGDDEAGETTEEAGATTGDLTASATITITDYDPSSVQLSVSPTGVSEATGGSVQVTAALVGGPRSEATDVAVTIGGGQAVAGEDYAAVAGFTITIPANTMSATSDFTLTPVDNDDDEDHKTVRVTGSTTVGLPVTRAILLIEDDDLPFITLSLSPDTLSEADGRTRIRINATLDRGRATGILGVDVTIAGTAESGSDYSTSSETANITITGTDGRTAIYVTPVDDTLDEGAGETIIFEGTANSEGEEYRVRPATLTLTDDDDAPTGITLSLGPADVDENGGEQSVDVTATLTGDTTRGEATDVSVSVGGGAATDDHAAVSDFTIQIPAGEASKTGSFKITPVDDNFDDDAETVAVTGTTTVGLTVTGADLTLTDDDDPPTTLTLTADDVPTVNGSKRVGEDVGAFTVTATLDQPAPAGGVTVTLAEGSHSSLPAPNRPATLDQDWTLPSDPTIEIAEGETSGTASITVDDDSRDEWIQQIVLTATTAQPALTADRFIAIIADNDPEVKISSITVPDGVAGATLTFTVNLDRVTEKTGYSFFKYRVEGSATLDEDFTASLAPDSSVQVAGVSSIDIVLTVIPDTITEGDENVRVSIHTIGQDIDSDGYVINSGYATITDDDDTAPTKVTLSVDNETVAESAGTGAATVTATLDHPAQPGGVTVTLTAGGTATGGGVDYTLSAASITIAEGATEGAATLDIVQDVIDEDGETIELSATVSGSLTVEGSPVTVSITDDDVAPTVIDLYWTKNGELRENWESRVVDIKAKFRGTQTVSTETSVLVTVGGAVPLDWLEGGEALSGIDYEAISDFTMTIPAEAHEVTHSFTITLVNDNIDEGDQEHMALSGTADGFTVENHYLTILDDDDPPTAVSLRLAPTAVTEGGGAQTVTVHADVQGSTTFGSATEVTVSVSAGTATLTTDYAVTTAAGTITIPAGGASASTTFGITPVSDTLVETGGETLTVGGTSGSLTVNAATLTITDDDTAPSTVTLSVDNATVVESAGTSAATVTATLDNAAQPGGVTVTLTAGGTATGGGVDYTLSAASITIAEGATEGTATLDIVQDVIDDDGETIELSATVTGSLTVEGSPVTVTITDDDDAPTAVSLRLAPATVTEGGGAQTVTVHADVQGSTTFGSATEVTVSVSAGTATLTTDYAVTTAAGTITIAAGGTTASTTFEITPVDDSIDDDAETVTVGGRREA